MLPALAPFLRDHPAVQIEIQRDVDRRATDALVEGRADLVLSQSAADAPGVVDVRLGDEEFVLVESRNHPGRRDVFLDVGPRDDTTELWIAAQPARIRPRRWTRSFLHDEPGILLGVELGLGRAVKPRHTLSAGSAIRIDPAYVPFIRPVYLQTRRQRYYGRLQQAVSRQIEAAVRARLAAQRRRS